MTLQFVVGQATNNSEFYKGTHQSLIIYGKLVSDE